MNALRTKWRQLNGRQRVMAVGTVVLMALVLFKYAGLPEDMLPLPHVIGDYKEKVADRRDALDELVRSETERRQQAARLEARIKPYIWRMGDRVPSAEMQAEIERLARQARVTVQTMGGHRINEESEHLRSAEIGINVSGTMRDIAKLLGAVSSSDRKFYWRSCRLRVLSGRSASRVTLSGSLRIFFAAPDAEQQLYGD